MICGPWCGRPKADPGAMKFEYGRPDEMVIIASCPGDYNGYSHLESDRIMGVAGKKFKQLGCREGSRVYKEVETAEHMDSVLEFVVKDKADRWDAMLEHLKTGRNGGIDFLLHHKDVLRVHQAKVGCDGWCRGMLNIDCCVLAMA